MVGGLVLGEDSCERTMLLERVVVKSLITTLQSVSWATVPIVGRYRIFILGCR